MDCSFCGSPAAHPATGCVYGARTVVCAACVREFWRWALANLFGKGGRRGRYFYEHAAPLCARCRRPTAERCRDCLQCPECCALTVRGERSFRAAAR